MNIFAVARFIAFSIHGVVRRSVQQNLYPRQNFRPRKLSKFGHSRLIFLLRDRLIKNMEFFLFQASASKTIFNADRKVTIIRLNRLLAIRAIITIVRILAIHSAVTQLALVAKAAIHAIRAVKNAKIIKTIVRSKTGKGHIAIPTFLRVLAVWAVFIVHRLQPHVRGAVPKFFELVQKSHTTL